MRRLFVEPTARISQIAIVNRSIFDFGRSAAKRYSDLIARAYVDLQDSPTRHGTIALGNGDYLYHLRYSARLIPPVDRVRNPRHVVAYRFDDDQIQITALLHDSMDIPARLRGDTPD